MKKTLFAAAIAAAAAFAIAAPAAAQSWDHGRYEDDGRHRDDYRTRQFDREWGGRHRLSAEITIRKNGRVYAFDRGDRLFYRLMEHPYSFLPGLTYQYTDRCNRWGCVAFVYDGWSRRPIDRIFAPHLPLRSYAWRGYRDFDPRYRSYGHYDRDDRLFDDHWRYDDDDRWDRDDDRWDDYRLEGG
jgi:hypothetical protein